MKTIRVFPRRTKATPNDEWVRIANSPGLLDKCDEVEISVTFTWDLSLALWLESQWKKIAPVKLGGPALGERGEDFVPGRYLKEGYVITSRGCPNKCWFCSVWRREGHEVRELPIRDGWNVLDDNLLACSRSHIVSVFDMLSRQERYPEFTGGLEAARLEEWHVKALREIRAKQLFFAYDTPDDLEPLKRAGSLLLSGGFTRASHSLRCYVLCGYPKDSLESAEKRMREAFEIGFTPMAMLWRNEKGEADYRWSSFQRRWARPAIIHRKEK